MQRALFGSTSDPASEHPLLLLERHDVSRLSVGFNVYGVSINLEFQVERLNLYLLRPGVAVLTLQVVLDGKDGAATTLEQAMQFNDGMRRSHVPYFFKDMESGQQLAGGRLPVSVSWKKDEKWIRFNLDGKAYPFDSGATRSCADILPIRH